MNYFPTPFTNIFTYTIQIDTEWNNFVTVGYQWAGSHPRSDVEIDTVVYNKVLL